MIQAAAWRTAACKASGGAAVGARRGVGITDVTDSLVKNQLAHRIAVAHVNAIIPGGIFIVSVYLRTSEGLTEANLQILRELGAIVRSLSAPWIIAGDWNIEPSTLQATNWHALIDGQIVATTAPTCNSMVYDYFVVHESLARQVAAIQRLDDAAASPHFPVRLLLRSGVHRHMARRLVRPAWVPPSLPYGPQPNPPSYDCVAALAQSGTTNGLNEAVSSWYLAARGEWSCLTGVDNTVTDAYFRWEPVVKKRALGLPGADIISNTWDTMAGYAREIHRIMCNARSREGKRDEGTAIMRQSLGSALKVHWRLPKTLRAVEGRTFLNIATSLVHAVARDCTHWAQSIATTCTSRARAIEKVNSSHRLAAWRAKLGAKGMRPTGAAFRWLKDSAGWKRSPLGTSSQVADEADIQSEEFGSMPVEEDDALLLQHAQHQADPLRPLSDQEAVEVECSKWAKLWKADDEYVAPHFEAAECEPLELLSVWAIKRAAASFPAGTGLGMDNVAPRAIIRLSEAAIVALALLFKAMELAGTWAETLNLVLIVLLPKSDGGLRPIGLFPTLVRVWMRSRLLIARAWESAHSLPHVYGSTAMGAYRATWCETFAAEIAASTQTDHIQALLDLIKCFESVPHQQLVTAARARGVPLTLLRLSLQAYRLRRTIGVDNMFSRIVVAIRGITAGSGFATTELRALLFDVVLEVRARWAPTLSLKVYVDDLTLSASGVPQHIVRVMHRALLFITSVIEQLLDMRIAPKKSFALAGRPSLAAALCNASDNRMVSHTKTAKLLGADNSAGRRRSTKVIRGRIRQVKKLASKLHSLRRQGVRVRAMARSAVTARVIYGVDVMGASNTVLRDMRSTVAHASAPPGAGKNADLILLTLDLQVGTIDPAFAAHEAPAKHWALAWWERWYDPSLLRAAFLAADEKLKRIRGSQWRGVTGPTATMILSLRRLGWAPRADSAMDDLGHEWSYIHDPPIVIQQVVRDSVRRWRARRVADFMPQLVPSALDVEGEHQHKILIPMVAPLGNLLYRGKPTLGVEWQTAWAPELASAITGGQWPQVRRAALRTADGLEDTCQLCNGARGTLLHRLQCPSIVPVGGWPAPPRKAEFVSTRINNQRFEIASTRGLFFALLPAPRPHDGWFEWRLEPAHNIELSECHWYSDGSRLDPTMSLFGACGFALVALTAQGTLVGIAYGVPPSWCRSAAGAEAWALLTILRICQVVPVIFTDCMGLLTTAAAGEQAIVAADRPLARIWGEIVHCVDDDLNPLIARLRWMPAHKAFNAVGNARLSDGSVLRPLSWRANRLVDEAAKAAAVHAKADRRIIAFIESARAFVQYRAAVLGQATYRANHCEICTEGGKTYKRDSSKKPRQATQTRQAEEELRAADGRIQAQPSLFSIRHLAAQVQSQAQPSSSSGGNQAGVNLRDKVETASSQGGGNHVGVNLHEKEIRHSEASKGEGSQAGANLRDAVAATQTDRSLASYVPTEITDDDRTRSLFSGVHLDGLVDEKRETAAFSTLPSAQSFSLSGPKHKAATGRRHSTDPQCVQRRAATAHKQAQSEEVRRQVQELAAKAKARDTTTTGSAAARLQALRDRIRHRQQDSADVPRGA